MPTIIEHEPPYKVAYFVGSLSKASINRMLAKALIKLAPQELEFIEVPIGDLPLYNHDLDGDYPDVAKKLKASIEQADAVLFVTPEYNRSIPGSLKNAIDWASRPWGQNSFTDKPSGVIGGSIGQIGTAVAQQSLRGVLSFCGSPQMTTNEAYIHITEGLISDDGTVSDADTREFLKVWMEDFYEFITRVLTVVPKGH